MKTSIPYTKIVTAFPAARQHKIQKRAAELIAEEFTLDLRKDQQITQEKIAQRQSGRRQGRVVRAVVVPPRR